MRSILLLPAVFANPIARLSRPGRFLRGFIAAAVICCALSLHASAQNPSVFATFLSAQSTAGTTPGSATTTTIKPPGGGWNYSAAALASGTVWNQIELPNPGTTSTSTNQELVWNSANNIALTSATGTATSVHLTVTINQNESGRIEPTSTTGGNTVLGPDGLMDQAVRVYYGGNSMTCAITGLQPNEGYILYFYGSATSNGQGARFNLATANLPAGSPAYVDVPGGNSGNIFSLSGTTYSLTSPATPGTSNSTAGPTWGTLDAVSSSSGTISFTTGPNTITGDDIVNGFQIIPYPTLTITAQPAAAPAAPLNGNLTLSVAAVGTGTLTYQWQKNGANLANGPTGFGSTISGATTDSLTILNVQNDDAGSYDAVVTNPGLSVTSSNAVLDYPVANPTGYANTYDTWKAGAFTPADQTNSNVSGAFANPSGDGISNLMKYALGLNPYQCAAAGLPVFSLVTQDGLSYPALTYSVPSVNAPSDILYVPESSTDSQTWSQANLSLYSITAPLEAGDPYLYTYVSSVPVTSKPAAFMRLAVEQTASVSVASGTLSGPQTVSITSPVGAQLYYTIDGSAPSDSSILYTGPITVSSSETIKIQAYDGSQPVGGVVVANYELNPATYPGPTAAPTAPNSLVATTGSSAVILNWKNNSTNASNNLIQEENGAGTWVTIATLSPTVTSYTVSGLPAESNNLLQVVSLNSAGESAGASTAAIAGYWTPPGSVPLPSITGSTYNIATYGASTSSTNNATAIQAAINAATAAGGGTVLVPSGTYLSGPLTLEKKVNLNLASGATLMMLPYGTWPSGTTPFITCPSGATDVEISGSGTINGQGQAWWTAFAANSSVTRPQEVVLNNATRVEITGITLTDSPEEHIWVKEDTDVTLIGFTIDTLAVEGQATDANTDGVDMSSNDVYMYHCSITDGDDNVVTGGNDIDVESCTFGVGHGCSIGSITESGVSYVTVNNCTFNGTTTGIRMKSARGRGGLVECLTYTNNTMTNVPTPISITSYYPTLPSSPSSDPAQPVTSTTPIWQNIIIANLTATGATAAGTLWGLPEESINDVTLSNVSLTATTGMDIYNAADINFLNGCSIKVSSGPNETEYNATVTGAP